MNPDQINALIADFEERSTEATRTGNQQGEYHWAVAADIVRSHLADAIRATKGKPDLRPSVRIPL